MLFYTDGQAYVFLAMLVCGALVGAWYDVLRRVRRLTMAGGVLTALLDVLFAVGALLETCGFLFLATRLDVRLYALLGAACGVTLYRFGLQPALDAVVSFLQKQLSKFVQKHVFKEIFHLFCNFTHCFRSFQPQPRVRYRPLCSSRSGLCCLLPRPPDIRRKRH